MPATAMRKRKRIPKNLDPRIPFNPNRFSTPMQHSAACIVARQGECDIYQTFIPLNILCTASYVDVVDQFAKKQTGCQRHNTRRRLERIASEFDSRQPLMLDSLLLSMKRSDVKVVKDGNGLATMTFTVDPNNRNLMVPDGQHRLGGISWADSPPIDMAIPATLVVGMDNLQLRRVVADIGGNVVKHDKNFMYSLAASFVIGEASGKISGAINRNDPVEVRKGRAAAAAEYTRSLSDSPLYDCLTLRSSDKDGRIPVARLVDFIDWPLARSQKLNGLVEPLDIGWIVIDFFRAVRILVGDQFSEGVMLSAKGMKVLSRLLWHTAEELIDETPSGFVYRGMHEGEYACADTRYEQVLELLRPLSAWQKPDDATGVASVWECCHADKEWSVKTWYARMLLDLGWADKPSCEPRIAAQLAVLEKGRAT